jgi:hypothetical protein
MLREHQSRTQRNNGAASAPPAHRAQDAFEQAKPTRSQRCGQRTEPIDERLLRSRGQGRPLTGQPQYQDCTQAVQITVQQRTSTPPNTPHIGKPGGGGSQPPPVAARAVPTNRRHGQPRATRTSRGARENTANYWRRSGERANARTQHGNAQALQRPTSLNVEAAAIVLLHDRRQATHKRCSGRRNTRRSSGDRADARTPPSNAQALQRPTLQ